MELDRWSQAHRVASYGRRNEAHHLFAQLIAATPTEQRLRHAIHSINLRAVHDGPQPPISPIPQLVSSAPLDLQLLAEEAALVSLYNSALRTLRSGQGSICSSLTAALRTRFARTLHLLPVPSADSIETLDAPVDQLLAYADACAEACVTISAPPAVEAARDWAAAAAAATDLLGTAETIYGDPSAALAICRGAQVLRRVEHTLTTTGATGADSDCSFSSEEEWRSGTIAATALRRAGDTRGALQALGSNVRNVHAKFLAASLLLYDANGNGDMLKRSKKYASEVAASGYRTKDAYALVARASEGRDAIRKWQMALDRKDISNPAGLWMYARMLGRFGDHAQQAQVLEAVEQEYNLTKEREKREEIQKNWRRRGAIRFGEHGVDMESVRAERAGALFAVGNEEEALKVAAGNSVSAMVMDGAVSFAAARRGLNLLDVHGRWAVVGRGLGRAERAVMNEDVDGLRKSCDEALRDGQLGGGGGGAEALVRGVVYHNMGVALLCAENGDADEWLAGAHTALEKASAEVGGGEATRMALAAAMTRCMALWLGGRRTEAAELWVAVRGSDLDVHGDAVDEVTVDEVAVGAREVGRGGIGDTMLDKDVRRMDKLCSRRVRAESAAAAASTAGSTTLYANP